VTHAELETELPWFVNGTATPRVRAAVEAELETCERCSADVAELRALGTSLRELDAAAPAPSAYAFTDTLDRIGTSEATAVPPPRRSPFGMLAGWWRAPGLRPVGGGLVVAALAAFFFITHLPFAADTRSGAPSPELPAPAPEAIEGYALHRSARSLAGAEPADAPAVGAPHGALEAVAPAGTAKLSTPAQDATSLRARQLARDGTLGLLVPDVPTAIARSEAIAGSNFGVVTGLEDDAPTSPGDRHTAHLTVSIPDDRFGATIDRLAALGSVTARTVKTEDLTDSIVDSDARLRNLRREERDLLAIMDRSGKVSDVLDVEQQLADTRRQIEELDAQTQAMRRRVAYATIAIDFSDEKVATATIPGPALQISDAWHAATQRLLDVTLALIAQLLVLVAFLPYLMLLGALGYVAYRICRRYFPRRF
jgi:anti-sigma factor RsiW